MRNPCLCLVALILATSAIAQENAPVIITPAPPPPPPTARQICDAHIAAPMNGPRPTLMSHPSTRYELSFNDACVALDQADDAAAASAKAAQDSADLAALKGVTK